MEKFQSEPSDKKEIDRRSFLKGTAKFAVFTTPIGGIVASLNETGEAHASVPETMEEQKDIEFSHSELFNVTTEVYEEQFEREIPTVEDFGSRITMGDEEKRTRIQYVSEMFNADELPKVIQEDLKALIVGLCVTESGFDAEKISPKDGKGVLQFVPDTWKEYLKSNPDAFIRSLVDQTDAASKLFNQEYRYLSMKCESELEHIKNTFFGGDTLAFMKYFMTPVLINAYNAGMGTMGELLIWFSQTYPDAQHMEEVFGKNVVPSKYDVFYAFARLCREKAENVDYDDEQFQYTFKVYSATNVLAHKEKLPEEIKVAWLG